MSQAQVPVVKHIVHLGHPIPPSLATRDTISFVLAELENNLGLLGTQPLPPLPRADVTRTVLDPALLRRFECIAPVAKELVPMTQRLVDYLLQVDGVPMHVTTKTLFSQPTADEKMASYYLLLLWNG